MGRRMSTDFYNGHRFATTSTAGRCRNECGWIWAKNDSRSIIWKFDEIYLYDFEPPYYEVPPMCSMSDCMDDLESYAPNGIEKHMAYGKEWDWPKGEYKEPVEEIEVKE
jgi:hypothetical protein